MTLHPRELTTEVRDALSLLATHGVPLGNQSVLLRGVNDNADVMKSLVHKLLMCRVRPYYLYQCDLIQESSHLRASVADGIEIIEQLRGHTTGYAIPQFVINARGGGGKVPVNPDYVLLRDEQRVIIRNYEGKINGDAGLLDPGQLDEYLTSDVKLLAMTHISNSLGTINPIAEYCERARRRGIVTLIDAAQSAGQCPIDVEQVGCDFLARFAHKMCGPTGFGVARRGKFLAAR